MSRRTSSSSPLNNADDLQSVVWPLIDRFFKDNPTYLVDHQLTSYNDFIQSGIPQIFRENNPIQFIEKENQDNPSAPRGQCFLYLGGKSGDKIYYGKPIIYDETSDAGSFPHYMYPNMARLRNMTYGTTIHFDVDIDIINYTDASAEPVPASMTLNNMYLGRIPIMVNSTLCILNGLPAAAKMQLGECVNDPGGYFIINGKEKCIISQEGFGDNILYTRKHGPDDPYLFSCDIRSVSEDSSKPIRYTSVHIHAPIKKWSFFQPIVVDVPNVTKPVPLFILMRALGIVSDKDIVEHIVLDIESNTQWVDTLIASADDAVGVYSQLNALDYIKTFTKRRTVMGVMEILTNHFLPHIGEQNYGDKAYFIGYMVKELLMVAAGYAKPTDRDNFKHKRVSVAGTLLYNLFREYYILQKRDIHLRIDKEFYYHPDTYRSNLGKLIDANTRMIFSNRIIEEGVRKAFKGNWGASTHTKKVGVVQDLNRLSWFTSISHLRKINLPLPATSKQAKPHMLHGSQWGSIDPVDTPDGGNVGLHKHLAISSIITSRMSGTNVIQWLRSNLWMKWLQECTPLVLSTLTKVFVNGAWVGAIDQPIETIHKIRTCIHNGILSTQTSATFYFSANRIEIFTDDGRLMRPVFYSYNGDLSAQLLHMRRGKPYTWKQATAGFGAKMQPDLLLATTSPAELDKMFHTNHGAVEYVDAAIEENALIATSVSDFVASPRQPYTHAEIHPSLMFGVMGNSIIFPEFNQLPRNVFSCGQSKQAVSLYHTNYKNRMDKTGIVLNYGQVPLIKSRYLAPINAEQHPYGVNTIVAIMSYTGYNVEDAILINKGSVDRGLFSTTYYTSYEAREETTTDGTGTSISTFMNIQTRGETIRRIKEGYDYSYLDENGVVREGTHITDNIILIGKGTTHSGNLQEFVDDSSTTKKGQLGVVDKTFMTEADAGHRIAKVRVRELRQPSFGDKMASRAGQKGTVGMIIPELDMPFTADGVRPDIIINPHALPSRMTIGQLVESLFGKMCAMYGAYGDCTAFETKGSNYDTYGNMLSAYGFHKSGNEILYDGFSGEQLQSDIFIGPTYYMRLKHMTKDKINYRATGKVSALTRQVNKGRANDGGLRIGEMERDGVLAHGMSAFLHDAYLTRGDAYCMAVCDKTGCIAVYNTDKRVFLSPWSDGPLAFTLTATGEPALATLSEHGRSFSLLRIPYAFKLLMHELQVMGVQTRIITDHNLTNVLPLTGESANIHNLLHIGSKTDIQKVMEEYKTIAAAEVQRSKFTGTVVSQNTDTVGVVPFEITFSKTTMPLHEPRSPDAPLPLHEPRSPDAPLPLHEPASPPSPIHAPASPTFAPASPLSPKYAPPI